jgi:lipid II:glycine glycyltransferase (peptidoglycan interpeptide bridge formation enzyme)
VFVARRTGPNDDRGRAIAWAIVTDYDGAANYVYAGATSEAREVDATVRLLWEVLEILRAEGIRTFDMGGVDSELSPTLAGVGLFKRKWGAESEIDPAWDVPAKPGTFALLAGLLRAKRYLGRRR